MNMCLPRDVTVMDPALTSSELSNPLRFVTNVMNKIQYRDDLETWDDIMRSFRKVDQKTAAKLNTMGFVIYMARHNEEKLY